MTDWLKEIEELDRLEHRQDSMVFAVCVFLASILFVLLFLGIVV